MTDDWVIRELDLSEIPEEITDKVGAKFLAELTWQLAGDADKAGWDQPSALLMIRQKERDTILGMAHTALLEVTEIPGFHQLLVHITNDLGGRPHHALIHGAEGWSRIMNTPQFMDMDTSDVVAVALLYEGWALIAPKDASPEQLEAQNALARERTIHTSPDKVETRLINLSGRNHLRVDYMQPRDGVPQTRVSQHIPGHPPATGSSGDLPTALHYFMATVELGQIPMSWEDWDDQFGNPFIKENS